MSPQGLQTGPDTDLNGADKSPLERLAVLLDDDMSSVNRLIIENMQSGIALIPQLAGHLIAAGGKRVRPLLTIASASMFGYQGDKHHIFAATVEFIHTATLLHDDVVDESSQRRGLASANSVYGNEAAVLVGDFLFSRAFQLMVKADSLPGLKILSDASAVIAEGEVLQLTTSNDIETDEDAYLAVISAKTAELFASACEVGALVAGATPEQQKAMRDYGYYIGVAFQIADDVLDYGASEERLGKTVGDDFREGKMTLPVVLALKGADDEERAFWQRCMGELDQKDGDLERATEIIRSRGVLPQCIDRARDFGRKAEKALENCPDGPMKQIMAELVGFIIERDY